MPKLKISRSKVIAEAPVAYKEREEVAAEGHRFYAQEASEFAVASRRAVSEALGRLNPVSCIPYPAYRRTT